MLTGTAYGIVGDSGVKRAVFFACKNVNIIFFVHHENFPFLFLEMYTNGFPPSREWQKRALFAEFWKGWTKIDACHGRLDNTHVNLHDRVLPGSSLPSLWGINPMGIRYLRFFLYLHQLFNRNIECCFYCVWIFRFVCIPESIMPILILHNGMQWQV